MYYDWYLAGMVVAIAVTFLLTRRGCSGSAQEANELRDLASRQETLLLRQEKDLLKQREDYLKILKAIHFEEAAANVAPDQWATSIYQGCVLNNARPTKLLRQGEVVKLARFI